MIDYEICDSSEVICPYCHTRERYGGDPIGDDGDHITFECENCNKEFDVYVSISVDHKCYPIEEEQ